VKCGGLSDLFRGRILETPGQIAALLECISAQKSAKAMRSPAGATSIAISTTRRNIQAPPSNFQRISELSMNGHRDLGPALRNYIKKSSEPQMDTR